MKNQKTKISVNEINDRLKGKNSKDGIKILVEDIFLDKIAYVCSFGSESAIILHMISKIKKNLPVVFINTLKLFQETIEYKNYLTKCLGLQNVIEIQPKRDELKHEDVNDDLWKTNTDKCCELRKVRPLDDFLQNYDAWFSGRKSYHSDERKENSMVEFHDKKFIVSPLLNWEKVEIDNYFAKYKLKPHPLVAHSFLSIGCTHCTSKSVDLNDVRSGRWKNSNKTECGIHKFKEK